MKKTILLISMFVCISITVFAQSNLLSGPEGITFHPSSNSYFVTNANTGEIIKIDEFQNQSLFYEGLSIPMGIECIDSYLIVASNNPATVSKISAINGELMEEITIVEANTLAHSDYDPVSNCVFVVSQDGQIVKVNASTMNYNIYVGTGQGISSNSQTCAIDAVSEYLYVFSWPATPIRKVSLTDSTDIQNAINPMAGQFIDCTKDGEEYIYAASWQGNKIYRFNSDCSNPPEVYATNFSKPAGLSFNSIKNEMAVCNFSGDSISYLSMSTVGFQCNNYDINNFEIYPNPAKNTIHLKQNSTLRGEQKIKIYDTRGNEVFRKSYSNSRNIQVDISDLKAGTYFIHLCSDSDDFVEKLVKIE